MTFRTDQQLKGRGGRTCRDGGWLEVGIHVTIESVKEAEALSTWISLVAGESVLLPPRHWRFGSQGGELRLCPNTRPDTWVKPNPSFAAKPFGARRLGLKALRDARMRWDDSNDSSVVPHAPWALRQPFERKNAEGVPRNRLLHNK